MSAKFHSIDFGKSAVHRFGLRKKTFFCALVSSAYFYHRIKLNSKSRPKLLECERHTGEHLTGFSKCFTVSTPVGPRLKGLLLDLMSLPVSFCETNSDHQFKYKEADFRKWLGEVDDLLNDYKTDKQRLYEKVAEGKEKVFGPRPEVLWRLTKATHLLAIAEDKAGNKQRKKELTFLTMENAKAALEADDKNFECHKWYAIATSAIGDYVSMKEKILGGHTVRKHVDIALTLKPDDVTLHHMLGRWCHSIASLSWLERQIASTLFAKVPESTFEEAVSSLTKAYELDPNWKENILHLAKAYIALGKYGEAIKWIDKGLLIESKGEDDHLAHEELLVLEKKYASYRK